MEGEGPTALIGAYEPGPGPGGLRALLPLAGMSVIEHQARRAVEAGAARILLLIDEAPPELSEAIARLRQDGIPTGMAHGIDQAADAIGQDETVLLIAEACLPEVGLLRAVVAGHVPVLAVLPDTAEHGQFERIDADRRWAGVALLDGHRLAETAAIRSDNSVASISPWSCQSTEYQCVENPDHAVTNRDSLKLKTIRKPIGA